MKKAATSRSEPLRVLFTQLLGQFQRSLFVLRCRHPRFQPLGLVVLLAQLSV